MSALQAVNAQVSNDEKLSRVEHYSVRNISAAIDRSPGCAFAILSAFYFIAVLSLSSLKLLWLDELITLQIARLADARAIWNALARGVDPNPPVTHLLVHYSRALFGDHEFAYRLPAAMGYWAGMLALFLFLRRYLRPTWALAGTVLSMTMGAFEYSYESRSYGIFYGLAMVAFLCWCQGVDPLRKAGTKTIALAGMVLALAAGISTNYFAVLALLPIAAGELVRTFVKVNRNYASARVQETPMRDVLRECIDYPIWFALLVSLLPLLAFRGMIAHSIAQFSPYAWNRVSLQQTSDSYTEMVEVVLYPLLAVFVAGAIAYFLRRRMSCLCGNCRARIVPIWIESVISGPAEKLSIPVHEKVGVFTFMVYPLLGFALASIRGGMLSPRFVIPVCFGFAISGILVFYRLLGRFPAAGIATLCFLVCWFVCRESYVGYWYEEQKQCFYKVLDHLPEAEADIPAHSPILIPDPLLALPFEHYAPEGLRSRVVFPVDFPAIRFYRHDDSPEENLWAGRNLVYSLRIEPLAQFESSAAEYLIIAGDGNWLLEDLREHSYIAQRLSINTRAGALGGFTPLAHGTPSFYVADSSRSMNDGNCSFFSAPPFRSSDELPGARPFKLPEDHP